MASGKTKIYSGFTVRVAKQSLWCTTRGGGVFLSFFNAFNVNIICVPKCIIIIMYRRAWTPGTRCSSKQSLYLYTLHGYVHNTLYTHIYTLVLRRIQHEVKKKKCERINSNLGGGDKKRIASSRPVFFHNVHRILFIYCARAEWMAIDDEILTYICIYYNIYTKTNLQISIEYIIVL